jgi:diguanylate cyclase (GGDEF)-like protein
MQAAAVDGTANNGTRVSSDLLLFDELPVPLLELWGTTIAAATASATVLLAPAGEAIVGLDLVGLVDPDERDLVTAFLAEVGTPDEPRLLEVRLGGPSGRAVGLTLSRSGERVLLAIEDRAPLRRLSAVIDAVADSTLLLDADGQVLWQSDTLASRLPAGYDNLGTHPVERLHPEDLPAVLESFGELASRPTSRISRMVRSRSVENNDVWQLIELIGAGRADHPDLGGVVVQVRNLDTGSEVESLAQTAGPLLSLAEAAPVGILLLDKLERVIFANRIGRELLGLVQTDDPTAWRQRVRASHRAAVDELVSDGLRGAGAVTVTVPATLADGSSPWLRARVAPHLGAQHQVVGVVVTLEDVTAEVVARSESERLLHMLDATSDFVTIFRPTGEILHTNTALEQVLDRLKDEGGSGRLADLIGDEPGGGERLGDALEAAERDGIWQGELDLRIGGDEVIPVSALALVHRDDDGALDWIGMVARDISELKQADARLRLMATVDHLTGLANRSLFTDHLERAVAASVETGRPVAVLFCDLDRFKEVNDRFGHAVGDGVLVTIADRLRAITRAGDLAARVGGDEFVILCEGVNDADALASLAQRVIESVPRPIEVNGDSVQVGISIGIALAGRGGIDGDRLLISADQAMYRAKATGGNRYRIHVVDSDVI